ncbi:ornithine carbamoyltransferase [Paraburkholderia tropica]|uniref:ornithine carbamoyltransferase n=1 Tax=Paraburkholderia tropica TaxID=92647 RepID=UPI0032B3201B
MTIRRLLTIADLTASDAQDLLFVAAVLETHRLAMGALPPLLHGRCLGMIFDETSLRTRSAFERAISDFGGQAIHYNGSEARIGRHAEKQEHLNDFVNVAGRFNDVLLSRIYDFEVQQRIAALSPVPFINGMCDRHHPTQALCDFLTLMRRFGRAHDLKIAFVGDGTNIALSLAQTASLLGATFVCATPSSWGLPAELTSNLRGFSATEDPVAAVHGAHAVIADAWVPMNRADEADARRRVLAPYRVTSDLMRHARPEAVFMHNLPAYRGEEVLPEVIDGPQSVIYDEAIARLHIARALLLAMLLPDWSSLVAALRELGELATRDATRVAACLRFFGGTSREQVAA